MTSPEQPERDQTGVDRRHLIRGGAILAGAAGVAAVGAVLAPKASATDGQPVVQGQNNPGTQSTGITIASSATLTPLTLTNPGGAALTLTPVTTVSGSLTPGQFATDSSGPYVGVSSDDGNVTALIITTFELDQVASPVTLDPVRILDTRSAAGRAAIVRRSSAGAIDSAGRLVGKQWIDIGVDGVNQEYVLDGCFINLTSTGSLANGYLTVYPPAPTPPATSLVNFVKGTTSANGTLVGVGLTTDDVYVIRIYASATSHVIVDLNAQSRKGPTAFLPSRSRQANSRRPATSASRRLTRTYNRRRAG